MTTPFDLAIAAIAAARYHNHRQETHSDAVSDRLFSDLVARCPQLRTDVERGVVQVWKNVSSPGHRLRKVDLFVGEPDPSGKPRINRVRLALENKSVITAHRNRTNRFDDLRKVLAAIHAARPEALLIATVLVGLADRVLNIPDQVRSSTGIGRRTSKRRSCPGCHQGTRPSGLSSTGQSAETALATRQEPWPC